MSSDSPCPFNRPHSGPGLDHETMRALPSALAASCSGGDPQAGVLLKTSVVTGQDLLAALEQTEAELLRNPHRRRIRLIIVDSIANVFRCAELQAVLLILCCDHIWQALSPAPVHTAKPAVHRVCSGQRVICHAARLLK